MSDGEEELEEEENAKIILLVLLSLCEQHYLAPRVYDVAKSLEWRENSFQPTMKKDLKTLSSVPPQLYFGVPARKLSTVGCFLIEYNFRTGRLMLEVGLGLVLVQISIPPFFADAGMLFPTEVAEGALLTVALLSENCSSSSRGSNGVLPDKANASRLLLTGLPTCMLSCKPKRKYR
jgi:hypothetical protein